MWRAIKNRNFEASDKYESSVLSLFIELLVNMQLAYHYEQLDKKIVSKNIFIMFLLKSHMKIMINWKKNSS